MRTKKLLRNSIYSLFSYVLLFIIGIILRRIFVQTLGVELLGYEGLFTNVLSFLNLAESGVGAVITYNLYKALAEKDNDEVAKLVMMLKYAYRVIGAFVLVAGIVFLLFLPYIITDNVLSWSYVRCIYLFYLASTLCTYFLSYKRVVFAANQMEYANVQVDTAVSLLAQITKILVLLYLKNYLIYLSLSILSNIVSNVIISIRVKKTFNYTVNVKTSKKDYSDRKVFKDIKNFLVHRIAYFVYGGCNNIIISIMLGISSVGLFSNYMLIRSQFSAIVAKIMGPLSATIGNVIYSDENEKGQNLFFSMEIAVFFISSFSTICFCVLFQPFIELWLGKSYLLPNLVPIMFGMNVYFVIVFEIVGYFRTCFGNYEKDRPYMIAAAISNLFVAVLLAKPLGVGGVLIGSNIGLLFIQYGRIKVVFSNYIKFSLRKYLAKHVFWTVLTVIEGALTYFASNWLPISVFGLAIRILLCLIIPNIINILIFRKHKDFVFIKNYIKNATGMLIAKLWRPK